jgi:TonB family protein
MEYLKSKLRPAHYQLQFLVVGLLILIPEILIGQISSDSSNTSGVILIAENPPEFPGGIQKLIEFINYNIKYPKEARKARIQGKVLVSIVVERDGTIKPESVTVEQGVHPSLDNEAVRVIRLMPKWIPANHQGRNVKAKTGIPISFYLR